MTTTTGMIMRAALAIALAAVMITPTALAQLQPDLGRTAPSIRDRTVNIERLLTVPVPEHTTVVAGRAEWNPSGNSLFVTSAGPNIGANMIIDIGDLGTNRVQLAEFNDPNLLHKDAEQSRFLRNRLAAQNGPDTLPMQPIAWSPDGGKIVLHTGSLQAGSRDTLHVITLTGTNRPRPLVIPTGTFAVGKVKFSPDGSKIFVASGARQVESLSLIVFDAANGRELARFAVNRTGGTNDPNQANSTSAPQFFDLSQDGTRLLIGFAQSSNFPTQQNRLTISILNGATMQFIRSIDGDGETSLARFNPADATRMLVVGRDVKIVNATTGATIRTIAIGRTIRTAEWRRDGSQIVTVTDDNTWQVWDAATGAQVRSGAGREAVFSLEGSKLAVLNGTGQAGQANTSITILNASTGTLTQTIQQAGEFITGLTWRPNGTGILGIRQPRHFHIWRVN